MIIAGGNSFLFVGILPFIIGVAALDLFPPVAGDAPAIVGNEGMLFLLLWCTIMLRAGWLCWSQWGWLPQQ
jgi:hypothetical protein